MEYAGIVYNNLKDKNQVLYQGINERIINRIGKRLNT